MASPAVDPNVYAARRDRLAALWKAEGVDAFLVTDVVNVSYLTGFAGDSSHLLLSSAGDSRILSDTRFTQQIAEECPGLDVELRRPGQTLPQLTIQSLAAAGVRSVGFENASLTVAGLEKLRELGPSLEWKGVAGTVESLRAVKDEGELAAIRDAIRIAESAFVQLRGELQPHHAEKHLADLIDHYMRLDGASCAAFPPIIAVGPRAGLPHAIPGAHRIGDSPFLLVDWGARGPAYNSDLTRMIVTGGTDDRFAEIYEVVLQANRKAIAAIRPGVRGSDVDSIARSHIDDAGYGDAFTHSLGHGVGRQVHESPALRPESTDVLQPGMVVTVEPGIYIEGWGGIRIEDMVFVTPDGCEVLTALPTDLEACRTMQA